jgi:hypothetical protein
MVWRSGICGPLPIAYLAQAVENGSAPQFNFFWNAYVGDTREYVTMIPGLQVVAAMGCPAYAHLDADLEALGCGGRSAR